MVKKVNIGKIKQIWLFYSIKDLGENVHAYLLHLEIPWHFMSIAETEAAGPWCWTHSYAVE